MSYKLAGVWWNDDGTLLVDKELKSSKVLEALRQNYKNGTHLFDDELLNFIEKELKALEIIRVVLPNVFWVMRTYTYEEYKKKCDDDTLLEEEYELLREVLL